MGVLGAGQTAPAGQANFALTVLNDSLIDAWKLDRLLIHTVTRLTWTLVSGTASYTVGTGGTVSIARPSTMNMQGCRVAFIDTANGTPYTELPLDMLTDDAFQAIPQKTLAATYPTAWYYNPTYTSSAAPYGTLTLYPVTNIGTLLGVIYVPVAASSVALSDTIALPPGYTRFYRTNLALEMLDAFPVSTERAARIALKARESKADVQRVNTRLVELGVDAALWPVQAPSNVYSGI